MNILPCPVWDGTAAVPAVGFGVLPKRSRIFEIKVRDRETRSPAPETSALPGMILPNVPALTAPLAHSPTGAKIAPLNSSWRGGRVVDGSGLENRQSESSRGFESHPLRQIPDVILLLASIAPNG